MTKDEYFKGQERPKLGVARQAGETKPWLGNVNAMG
jgi:hypothetical protein